MVQGAREVRLGGAHPWEDMEGPRNRGPYEVRSEM